MILAESPLIGCGVCQHPAISYVVTHLYADGARLTRHYCEYHCPDGFTPARAWRDDRYTAGYVLLPQQRPGA